MKCFLDKTNFSYNDKNKLKGWKKINHANANPKTMLMSDKIDLR